MYLHITFSDGSNPFVRFGDMSVIEKELKRWDRNYEQLWRRDYASGVFVELKERVAMPTNLFAVGG